MRSELDIIKKYLDNYIEYDWISFNNLGMGIQCQKWDLLSNNFIKQVEKEYRKNKVSFNEIYDLIKSYDDKFSNLPIKGKLYFKVNNKFISSQLTKSIKDIEYQQVIKTKNLLCNCETLSKFGKEPKSTNLKEIGILNEGYYLPKILKCNNCNFLWSKYISDDSIGRTIIEKHDPKDNYLIEYYNN